ncbi:hypothetical protein DV736_g4096, partial [Chaetothyriales sp. CBS 134916]
MSLPTPTTSFTIPSLHDDLELDCRIYYPQRSGSSRPGQNYSIVAHPYAPLGGSYDDPVVARVGSVLLRNGVLLGTFNFRGAAGSAGRTSWSGNAELGDYVAFYVLVLALINATQAQLTNGESQHVDEAAESLLILGGYSYGSMIVSCLPPAHLLQSLLEHAAEGSTEFEIKSRANQLGKDYAAYVRLQCQGSLTRGRGSLRASETNNPPGRMGGYSSEEANRRVSGESWRRSMDRGSVRRSLDRVRQRLGKNHDTIPGSIANIGPSTRSQATGSPTIAYLLISPLLPPVSALTTMFGKPSFHRQSPGFDRPLKDQSSSDEKFHNDATCIVYGGKDQFTSSKKIKKWTHELAERSANPSLFSAQEVENAAHFWVEAPSRLQAIVGQWLLVLLAALRNRGQDSES